MISTEEQKAMDEELLRECGGYHRSRNKPDGAYIEEYGFFFNINKIKRLIERGADVGAKDRDGDTPLHLADSVELAKLLIASGADVGAKDKWWGNTPLHSAVAWNKIEIAKLLIDSGADMGAKDIDGETPLHVAVWEDNIAVAKLLIASGADVNAKGWNGFTPLDWAKSEEMEALLIEHGAK